MNNKRFPKNSRKQNASTMVSLLVATVIMSFVAISMMSLMSLNTIESVKAFNKGDNLTAARVALDKVGRLVRMARTLGDVQGEVMVATDPYSAFPPGPSGDGFAVHANNVSLQQVLNGSACNTSATFPSIADVYYNPTNGTELGQIATWPWGGSPNAGYTLDDQTLVVQVQTFTPEGWPRMVQGQNNLPALDTYVFRIVDDNDRNARLGPTRWYRLEVATFPAPGAWTNMPAGIQPGVPTTLLSGIVGPLDPATQRPSIFRYITCQGGTVQSARNFVSGTTNFNDVSNLVNFKGVLMSVQVLSVDAQKRGTVTNLRSEFYLRNNSSATIMGGA
ncbi:MAG: hypothetical protein K2X77_22810 [Candidatus Obscuribacterales bacterium]|jgi:hypothetical protein|nr:hypothetical protein [Candidatus Obscuribacterales bacterium]